jgi:hypothetical protein
MKFYESASSENRDVTCRQTEGDITNGCFLQFFVVKVSTKVLMQPISHVAYGLCSQKFLHTNQYIK